MLVSCNSGNALEFSAFTITDKAGTVNIALAQDGTVSAWGKKAGTLSHDGTLTDATGRQIATLSPEGMLTGANGNTLLHLMPDGTMHIEDSAEMQWNNNGELTKGGQKLGYFAKPADADSYRAASVVFYFYSGLFAQ